MLRSIGKQSGESVWNIQQMKIASFHQNAVWCYYLYVYCFYVGGVVAYGSLSPSVTI